MRWEDNEEDPTIRSGTDIDQYMKPQYPIALLALMAVFLLFTPNAQATHIRAGELTAERISTGSALTYRFTVMLYRDVEGVPAQPGTFEFGYESAEPVLVEPESMGFTDDGQTEILRYRIVHTFPSPGTYKVSYFEQNRNPGVRNMFASGNTAFYIESEFRISPVFGLNSSPRLLILPVDKGAVGQRFIHNPGAYDPDGDSLSYRLTICKQGKDENGEAIEVNQYQFPDDPDFGGEREDGTGPATFTINPITGDVIWDAPGEVGEYNVAFYIDEWRDGIRIGSVNRDMQIIIEDNPNNRPNIILPRDTCIVAGSTLIDTIRAEDPDSDFIELTGRGGLFDSPIEGGHANRATLTNRGLQPPNGYEEAIFQWNTVCSDVRREAYQATFKAEDAPVGTGLEPLVDLQTWLITVVGPAPDSLTAEPDLLNNSVTLNWAQYACANAEKMTIWRRKGSFDFNPENCETGIPEYTGYRQIAEVPIGQTAFIDDNGGLGLDRGVTYCYRIYAVFPEPKGGESYASMEVCVFIPQLAPYIVEVNVLETDRQNGEIRVSWTKPIDLDTVQYPRPLTYTVTRSEGLNGTRNRTTLPLEFNEEDTTFIDTGLDTERLPYNYRLNLFSQGNLVDTSSTASSVFLRTRGRPSSILLNWEADVPWSNASNRFNLHYIYREDPNNAGEFIIIDSVDVTQRGFVYEDLGDKPGFPIEEKEEYCYKIMVRGTYENPRIREPLINFSQISCAVALDTIAPCPPTLSIDSLLCQDFNTQLDNQNLDCTLADTLFNNRLSWQPDLSEGCDTDIVSYNLYYSPRRDGDYELIATNLLDTVFIHENISSVAGCYVVTALDANGNESDFSNQACNDNCPQYVLPNVFTPNGDGFNDFFVPFKCINFVRSVEVEIYNRWGELVFSGDDDIYINWDGTDKNGDMLPAGTYYYVAILQTIRLNQEDELVELKGWVNLAGANEVSN